MWVVTRSDWPVLINLDRAAQIGYQQVAKFAALLRWGHPIDAAKVGSAKEQHGLIQGVGGEHFEFMGTGKAGMVEFAGW